MPKNMANHSSRKYPKPLCKCSHLEYVLLILLITLQLKGWEHNCLLSNVRPFYFFALDKNCLMRPSFHSENTALSFFSSDLRIVRSTMMDCRAICYSVPAHSIWCYSEEKTLGGVLWMNWRSHAKMEAVWRKKSLRWLEKKSPRQLCSQLFNKLLLFP